MNKIKFNGQVATPPYPKLDTIAREATRDLLERSVGAYSNVHIHMPNATPEGHSLMYVDSDALPSLK